MASGEGVRQALQLFYMWPLSRSKTILRILLFFLAFCFFSATVCLMTMNQNIFTVEYLGQFRTIRTCNDALGAARHLVFGLEKPFPIERVSDKATIFNGKLGKVTVARLDHVSLSCI